MAASSSDVLQAVKEKTSESYYFDSYSHHGIHEEMLKDTVRTTKYRDSIIQNQHLFKGKVVLDVGCGTGILSMFAAKAGASKVIGIDASSFADTATEIVKLNKLDHIITIIKGRVEEVTIPVDKVDIIVSEWMGYFLVYESMLDTVLYARDKWLNPGGLIFPDKLHMYVAGVEDGDFKEEKVNFWDDVYGFDMSCVKPMVMLEPLVDSLKGEQVCTTSNLFFKIDMYTIKKEDLDFSVPYSVKFERDDKCHGLICWFDTAFTHGNKIIGFSTGPKAKYTHWKQVVFYFDQVIEGKEGEVMSGILSCKPNAKNPRDLDINIAVDFDGKDSSLHRSQEYRLR